MAAVGVIQSGWWTQEAAHKAGIAEHLFLSEVWTRCVRLGAASIVGLSSLPRDSHEPSSDSSASGTDRDWEQTQVGERHDPVEKHTPGRTHDGTIHVWIHPSVVGNSFGGKFFVDGSLMCKYGSQRGQAGWAVTEIHETSHELVCSAHGAMPISLPVQRRILRAELWALWQAVILSEPGATFVSDCATVLRGLERGSKWCTAARRPHADMWRRIWDCFRDIGDEAHVDSVTKCKAHLSNAERAKLWTRLVASWLLATNGLMSWPKRERVMTPSNPSCLTLTRELSKRAKRSSVMLAVSSSKRKEESDGLT